MRPGKLYALQVVRALAAILVIWTHTNDMTRALGLSVLSRDLGDLRNFGACGVDLFFVLSGFVVSLSVTRPQNPNAFIGRRLVRIYPLCWIVLALYVILNPEFFAPGFPMGHAEVVGRVAYSTLLLPAPTVKQAMGTPWLPASWTLVHEVFFYFCLYAGLRLRRWDARLFSVMAVVAFVALDVLLYGVLKRTVPFVVYYGCPIALEFVLGVGLGYVLPRLKLGARGGWALVGLGALAFLATAVRSPVSETSVRVDLLNAFARVLAWGVPATLVIGGLSLLDWTPRSRLGRAAVYAGDACYSIYLFQWLPMKGALLALPWLASAVGGDVATVLTIAFTALSGVALYALVERPLMHRLNARFFPKTPQSADAGMAPPELEGTLKPSV